MARWRALRGWSEAELREYLDALEHVGRNFDELDFRDMTADRGWRAYGSRAIVGREAPGPPLADGPFARGRDAVANFRFSDPDIVKGHFDTTVPLIGRRMALELKVLGLRYLCGVAVAEVREEAGDAATVFGFRYETLRGHIEAGAEYFLLIKTHETGEIAFRVDARWREGDFPNWWSRLGFQLVAPRYQRRWHRRAHGRLHSLMLEPAAGARPRDGRLAHEGPDVLFYDGQSEGKEWEAGSGKRESRVDR